MYDFENSKKLFERLKNKIWILFAPNFYFLFLIFNNLQYWHYSEVFSLTKIFKILIKRNFQDPDRWKNDIFFWSDSLMINK